MKRIQVGIIGTGWIGGIRAHTCANHPLVEAVHLAEIDTARLNQVATETRARTATTDYHELLNRPEIDAVIVPSTPETTHYPFTRDCLLARKHTFLEKPMGIELKEADELFARRIGIETMDNAAACRTYNVLASEGRRVVAALLLESSHFADAHLLTATPRNGRPASTSTGHMLCLRPGKLPSAQRPTRIVRSHST